ncbi:MAG: EAL domain-containing protein [Cyanobacteria bacterium P01_A01_bin.116]
MLTPMKLDEISAFLQPDAVAHSSSEGLFLKSSAVVSANLHGNRSQSINHQPHGTIGSRSTLPEPWQAQPLPLGYPTLGLGLLTGVLGLSFTFLWLRIQRLTDLVHRRDHQIHTLSATDSLTGLINRKQLIVIGNDLLKSNRTADIALLCINLNRFSAINDVFGHDTGDEVLWQVSCRLKSGFGESVTLARIGADEFALLLTLPRSHAANSGSAQLCRYAEHLFQILSRPFEINGQSLILSGRLGIALLAFENQEASAVTAPQSLTASKSLTASQSLTAPQYGGAVAAQTCERSFIELLTQAVLAMSKAKAALDPGIERSSAAVYSHYIYSPKADAESRYALFHPSMQSDTISQVQFRQALKMAIHRKQLRVRYQPIVDLQSARTIGFEALVRWQHPTRGLLSPSAFLPAAEEMGLMVAIDRWVMQTACAQISSWSSPSSALRPSLSVNLSAAHLAESDLADYVQQLLCEHSMAPHQLNLEITESVMIGDTQRVIETLIQVKALGVSVSLDDFGTGYSSLCYLHQFPVDVLKIDRSFVRCLGAGKMPITQQEGPPHGEVILKAILALAKGLDLRVIAEGIERDEQLLELRQLQCSYGQGNFFSQPLKGPSARKLL